MSRDYWPYFKDQLGYPQIQRPGPLALLARAEAGQLGEVYASGAKVRDQFFPALAEAESLNYHGQARGVQRRPDETEAQYRIRVKEAFAWQKLAGRKEGLKKIFAAYGFQIDQITELSGDRWAEFDLDVAAGDSLTAETWERLYWLADEYKRASAKLRTMRLHKAVRGLIRIKSAVSLADHITVYPPKTEPAPARAALVMASGAVIHERLTVFGRLN